jgi:formamidopyrimidine-DNA glycosylase
MPELPDVENFRRSLRRRALHQHVAGVHVGDARALDHVSARQLARATRGSELTATRRHGKHLFVEIDPDQSDGSHWLHFHFGMTGFFAYFDDESDDPEHDRVRFDLAEGGHLAFVDPRLFGRVGLVESPEAYIEEKRIGPDALSASFDVAALRRALAGKRSIKTGLMDQSAVAGIGNVYADEILFQARLDPHRSPSDLDLREVGRLHRAIGRVRREAISRGAGSEAILERVPRTWLLPHRRSGDRCPRCGGTIRACETGGRRGYWCPRCQG